MQLISKFVCFATALLMGLPVFATDRAPQLGPIAIYVKHGDWGTARVQDIEKVLRSVTGVLLPYFPQRASERVVVAFNKQGPRVLLEKSPDGSHQVLLNVQDTRWDQFAYQFSHELCHIFTNFEHREISRDTASRDHQWFEEALCEAVSLFTLNRLASSWEYSPPYPGWEEYAPAFRQYANRLLTETHRHLHTNESIARWFRANQTALNGNPYLREKNELLATRLLSLLENTPGSLEAIGYLNLERSPSAKSLKAYLESWYSCCPEKYRAFISQVTALFEERNISSETAVALTFSYRPLQ